MLFQPDDPYERQYMRDQIEAIKLLVSAPPPQPQPGAEVIDLAAFRAEREGR